MLALSSMARTRSRRAPARRPGPLALPEGITPAEWAMEKARYQNPRIRAFLGCIRMLDELVETDYHLLHCSPARLRQVWLEVRDLASVLRNRLSPALRGGSKIPRLEEARQSASVALRMLEQTLLAEIDAAPEDPSHEELLELRKLLCVAMGQLQTFLSESFGRVVAADPRSLHDVDYYLSRRFPRDIEESEWLLETVGDLHAHLQTIEVERCRLLTPVTEEMLRSGELPRREAWGEVSALLVGLYNDLAGRLKEVLCLHGIRFEEMSLLNRYSVDIPTKCLQVFEIHELASDVLDALDEDDAEGRRRCRIAVCRRLARLMEDLDRSLRDLVAFVPLWLHSIEKRRALVLGRSVPASGAEDNGGEAAVSA